MFHSLLHSTQWRCLCNRYQTRLVSKLCMSACLCFNQSFVLLVSCCAKAVLVHACASLRLWSSSPLTIMPAYAARYDGYTKESKPGPCYTSWINERWYCHSIKRSPPFNHTQCRYLFIISCPRLQLEPLWATPLCVRLCSAQYRDKDGLRSGKQHRSVSTWTHLNIIVLVFPSLSGVSACYNMQRFWLFHVGFHTFCFWSLWSPLAIRFHSTKWRYRRWLYSGNQIGCVRSIWMRHTEFLNACRTPIHPTAIILPTH